jgi:predicted Ser/Thr protein kinase
MKLDRVIAVRNNKTVFRDGRRCVKIFSPDFPKKNIFSEALNHAKVEEYIDFVPRVLEVIRHDRNWAIVYDFVKGKTLLQWMEEEPEAFEEQLSSFVLLQAKIHQTKAESLNKMKDLFFDAIDSVSLEPNLKAALRKGLEKKKVSSALCHGDFVPSNVIVGEDGKFTVIDWASAFSGEPLADVAATYLLAKIRMGDRMADAYRKAYLGQMQKNDGTVEEWIPYAAVFLMKSANEATRNALLPYVKSIENKGETK